MKIMTRCFSTLGVLALFSQGSLWTSLREVHAAEEKTSLTKASSEMVPVLENYYQIQQALASDQAQGIKENAALLISAAKELKDKKLSQEIQKAAQKIATTASDPSDKGSLTQARKTFKQLSKPISEWVKKNKPEGWSVVHCPMAGASWVQKDGDIQNPYYGKEMLSCGAKVT